ncbi:MAG: hypothetical protein HQL56_03565 [Magnetococcales bacterium]|nr:hypothetical protein [Magnetococcales bacterium]
MNQHLDDRLSFLDDGDHDGALDAENSRWSMSPFNQERSAAEGPDYSCFLDIGTTPGKGGRELTLVVTPIRPPVMPEVHFQIDPGIACWLNCYAGTLYSAP